MKQLLTRIGQAAIVASLSAILISATVFAGGGPTTGESGSCSVNPNPVAVTADYTLTGTGLGADAIVNILISDSSNTTSWNLQADANGSTSLVWHSYWTGTSNVTFQEANKHHGWTVVASCSFEVN
jgi:hypothetical protein